MDKMEAKEYFLQAQMLISKEKYEEAIELLDKAIDIDKMNIEYYIEKGIAYANLEKWDQAEEEFKKSLKIDRNSGISYFHLGNIAILKNENTEGVENYNKAILNGYDDVQIYVNLGMMYEEENNLELALRNYQKAILKDSLRVDARVRKATIYITQEKWQEALQALDELILADPDLYDGYHMKSLVLAELNRIEEAFAVLDDALALFPTDPAFMLDKINLYMMQNSIDKAKEEVEHIEKNVEMDNDSATRLNLEKARIYAAENNLDATIDSLQKVRELSKEDNEVRYYEATFLLMSCYYEKKDYEITKTISKELIDSEIYQYSLAAYYIYPMAYKANGETEKAKELFKECIAKLRNISLENPTILDTYLFRAMCLKEIEEFDKAMELTEYLLQVDDGSSEAHALKAEVLFAQGKEEEAINEKKISESLKN